MQGSKVRGLGGGGDVVAAGMIRQCCCAHVPMFERGCNQLVRVAQQCMLRLMVSDAMLQSGAFVWLTCQTRQCMLLRHAC
jgi:hypothetical protein